MESMQILLLTSFFFNPTEAELEKLRSQFPHVVIEAKKEKEHTLEDLQKAHIVLGMPHPAHLKQLPNLLWLQTPASGIAPYVDKSLYATPTPLLTNGAGTYGKQIANYVMGTIIGFNQHLFAYRDQMREKKWFRYLPNKELSDSTILIIGVGDIGSHVAHLAKAHQMKTIGIRKQAHKKHPHVDETYSTSELEKLLPLSDYVVLCAASTDQTHALIDEKALQLMKKEAVLINVGRGNLVDEQALIAALQNNHIKAAVLDVTSVEPLPPTSELWTLENVLITPHISALSEANNQRILTLFADNLQAFLTNKPLKNLIDFTKGY